MQNQQQNSEVILEIRLFGALTILRGEGEPVPLYGRKDRALLAYLAAHSGMARARDHLAALFWPNASHDSGRASLRQSLSMIRKALGPVAGKLISAERDTVLLGGPGLVTDIAALEAIGRSPDRCHRAILATDGGFLAGMTDVSTAFDSWRATEERRLTALACSVMSAQADLAETERRFSDAADLLLRALAAEPLAEDLHRKLMRVQASQGRSDAALRQYRNLELTLEAELGVRPEKETAELARDIRERRQKVHQKTAPVSRATKPGKIAMKIDREAHSQSPSLAIDLSPPEIPSIAVLPFKNMTSEPQQDFFADGMTEEIITALSKAEGLFAVSRNSTFTYKGKTVDLQDVGEELGVRYVLIGNVRRSGERVRVSAQLIDAETGTQLWAERYDRKLTDVFAIQDEITREVLVGLEVKLTSGEQARIWSGGTRSLEAWECVRLGMEALNRVTPEDRVKARTLLNKAPEFDPDYATAWVSLGWLYFHEADISTSAASGSDRSHALDYAIKMAHKGLEIDPASADAHALLGLCFLEQKEFDDAVAFSEKAVALAPSLAQHFGTTAAVLNKAGKPERAFDLIRRAMRLCPIYPAWYLLVLGNACRLMRHNDDAVAVFEEAVKRNPDGLAAQLGLASTLGELHRIEDAQVSVAEILRIDPDFSVKTYVSGLSYRDQSETTRFARGLRAAGLPN